MYGRLENVLMSDKDVVLAGSALHQHLVSSGYTDIELREKEKDKGTAEHLQFVYSRNNFELFYQVSFSS